VEEAERWLVDAAGTYNPKQLRVLGRRILEVIAPHISEAAEAKLLQQEEAAAESKTSLTMKPVGDGTTRITGVVADAVAHRLRTYLEAFAQPRLASPATQAVKRSRLLGEAFGELLEAFDSTRLPLHGGDATTVIITIPLTDLQRDLTAAGLTSAGLTGTGPLGGGTGAGGGVGVGVAELGPDFGGSYRGNQAGPAGWGSGGDKITATQARRLACTAGIIPAVLGGKGEILDLGRRKRLFSPGQRKALRLRDRHCRAEGCTVPATWCEAHHKTPWSHGGTTDLNNGVLLCSHHHRVIHDPNYHHEWLPNGNLHYHKRT